jgi:TolB-like protein/Flp pilus assembly protein TadD
LLYLFEDFVLDTDRRELGRGPAVVPIAPLAFDFLEFLIRNRERVLTKDDLIASIWNGRIVSESAFSACINAARSAINDTGEEQRLIRTLPRKGMRFVGEVREELQLKRAIAAGAAEEQSSPALTLPDRPSIAVLPFTNMSDDPRQDYFADGMVEEIITALSRLRWLFVIARNSSFTYKGRAVDVKQVGRELGVRYVLEGSVRKAGDHVRITGQLVDTKTGAHVWADRFDGDLIDVFALQDEITKKVVAVVEPKLLEAEGTRSKSRSPEDLGAWDMVVRANSLFWRLTKADSESAIALLNRAVELYPDYAPAQSMLAFVLLASGHFRLSSAEFGPQLKRAAILGARAAELDDSDPWAHLALGFVAVNMRRTGAAVGEFERALDLNPNFAAAHGYLGFALAVDGQSDQAIAHLQQAIRMSPHDPQNAIFNVALAAAHYHVGNYTDAVGFARKALQQRPGLAAGNRVYVASLAQAGQIDEARAALARLKELHPELSIAWMEKYVPCTPATMAKYLEGMRKAGLQ